MNPLNRYLPKNLWIRLGALAFAGGLLVSGPGRAQDDASAGGLSDDDPSGDAVLTSPDLRIPDIAVPIRFTSASEEGFEEGDDAVSYDSRAEYLQSQFIRPGVADPGSRVMPFRAARRLAKGLRLTMEAGTGFDSNTLLNNGFVARPGLPPPGEAASEDIGHRGGMASFFRINLGYNSSSETDSGKPVIFGFNLGGDIVSYDRGGTDYGRDAAEPYISPYMIIRGGKTTVRVSTSYDLSEGNYLFSSDNRREAPVAEAQTYGFNVGVDRALDRGSLNYTFSFLKTDFDANTLLNDQRSIINDLSYLYQPTGMPKTRFGAGLRLGHYETSRNPDESFIEPSFRVSYSPTAKTSVDGRIGVAFRDLADTGPTTGAIPTNEGDNARFTYAFGFNWNATARTRLRLEAYRDWAPSLVNSAESYNSDGFRITSNTATPFWRLSLSANAGFEWADYYSNVAGAGSQRDDSYFRAGLSVGRPLDVFPRMDSSVSLFYDYSENKTNDFRAAFDRHFTGIRFSGSL